MKQRQAPIIVNLNVHLNIWINVHINDYKNMHMIVNKNVYRYMNVHLNAHLNPHMNVHKNVLLGHGHVIRAHCFSWILVWMIQKLKKNVDFLDDLLLVFWQYLSPDFTKYYKIR